LKHLLLSEKVADYALKYKYVARLAWTTLQGIKKIKIDINL